MEYLLDVEEVVVERELGLHLREHSLVGLAIRTQRMPAVRRFIACTDVVHLKVEIPSAF